jgi:catalase
VETPILAGGTLPVIARFSLFAGVPDLPDNDDGASPVGIGLKIKGADGDFDMQAFNHRDFIVATSDEFAAFLRSLGATRPDSPHPNPIEEFLAAHPHARDFLGSRTYPGSFAEAKYFGANAEKFTNAKGQSVFVRYQFIPRAGERYLSPEERKAQSASYLQDEIVMRAARGPIRFDWYAQVAQAGDVIDDPSIAWPDTRRLVKLGTFSFDRLPADPVSVDRALLFQPGSSHPGVDPADPMLMMRNTADAISFGQRQ